MVEKHPSTSPTAAPHWSSRAAKRLETLKPRSGEQWTDENRLNSQSRYRDDPEAFTAFHEKFAQRTLEKTQAAIASGEYLLASASPDRKIADMQVIVDALAARADVRPPPKLVIMPTQPGSAESDIGLYVPAFIEIDQNTANNLSRLPDMFKAVAAHEIAHIVNGDVTPQAFSKNEITPPNRLDEVLADRRGALIHGNPHAYARALTEMITTFTTDAPHVYTPTALSANARARALIKWANILEREGALDRQGNVIPEKAEPIYERAKHLTKSLVDYDLAVKHPTLGR